MQMKFLITFLLIFLSFGDEKAVPLDATVVSTNIVLDPPPANNVTVYGEAHVFMCKRFANDQIAIQRFINPMNHTPPAPAGSEQGGKFTPLPGRFIDGVVTCQFLLSDFAPQRVKQLNTLRPLSQSGKYHPLFAVGLVNATGDAQYHDGREPQPGLVQLDQNQNLIYHQNSSKLFNEIYPSS
ncbi:unnamed protein product [Didymodactylos carnosus]|uniref:Uncharacterized protein n=1 Tax=Didymodactylos carnosus TaxID=1234261 RepID=A0A8S2INX7_9BILA|nr:unnamed protein product [Didymodactylos carnosus]CAF3769453.1 unnamed protein product [Didymodactylos carnosus]